MGRGIAFVSAAAGLQTTLVDLGADRLADASAHIDRLLAGAVSRGRLTEQAAGEARGRLHLRTQLAGSAGAATVVIEAIGESLSAKRQLFAQLDAVVPPGALLASNTSSLSIAEIAAATRAPQRVVGMHFFNPPHAMKLVEVVAHEAGQEAAERAAALARRLGKQPIVVRDSPGFASSRLGVALGLEAMRMLEAGVATAQDIDTAMELGYGHPMGPLRVSDLVGLDVRLDIAAHLHRTLGARFEPPAVLKDKVAAGELGKKTGKGFYEWPPTSS
jgi:3-hydroxybutyryl-CoA dehydrogenase